MCDNKYKYLLPVLLFFFVSCEKEVDYNGQLPDHKINLSCFVEADSILFTEVYRTWTIAEESGEPLTDASVALFINGEFKENLRYYNLGMQPGQYYYPPGTYFSTYRAKEGDLVRLEASCRDYPVVSSETLVPGSAAILSVDTVTYFKRDNENSSVGFYMRCFVKIKDLDAGKKNYYRLLIESQEEQYLNGVLQGNNHWTGSVTFDYDQEAVMKDGFASTTDEIVGTDVPNDYRIFSDEVFDGKEYTLNISFPNPIYSTRLEFSQGKVYEVIFSYRFKLVTMSESSYLFLRSFTHYNHLEEGPLTEPVSVFTNVNGGLGIVGASNTYMLKFRMPAKEEGRFGMDKEVGR